MLSKAFVKVILLGLLVPIVVLGEESGRVNLYLFHSETCSHCKKELGLLEELESKYSYLDIYTFEIHDEENYELFLEVKERYNIPSLGVPVTIIGDTYYQGYDSYHSKEVLMKTITYYSIYGYEDWLGEKVGSTLMPVVREERGESLQEFLNSYGNVKLLGFIDSNSLDIESLAVILGFLAGSNLFMLIGYGGAMLFGRGEIFKRLLFIFPFLEIGLSLVNGWLGFLVFLIGVVIFLIGRRDELIGSVSRLVMFGSLVSLGQDILGVDYFSILILRMEFLEIGIVSKISYCLIYVVVGILLGLGWIAVLDKLKKKLRIL